MKRFFLLLSVAIAVPGMSWAATRSKGGRTASAAGKPNVLFIIADDLRDYVGWMGGHPQARTPNMDRLAAMGVRFTNAHCNYALCNPSRTSLLTGMLPSSSGVFDNEQDWRRSVQVAGKMTLPEYFQSMGYATAAGGKIFHANHGGPEGRLTGWHGGRRGFEQEAAWGQRFPEAGVQIPDLPVHTGQNFNGLNIWHWDWGTISHPDELTDDGAVVEWAGEFLRQKAKQPFFLAVGLYRPHSPWYVPEPYFEERPLSEVQLPVVKGDDLDDVPAFAKGSGKENPHELILKNNKWQEAVRAYLASVTFCDRMLGRVLEALEQGPNAKDTIVVFTSDHGWYLGEKGMWHKGKLWEEATHVPLTILAPGVTKPETVSTQPVALVDLYPTLCDLAKLPKPEHLDGESLLPLLRDPAAKRPRPAVTAMGGGEKVSYAARDERWRYIRYADGSEELYDHESDPKEWTNLAGQAEHAAVKTRLAVFFPKEFKNASRPAAEVVPAPSPDGTVHLQLQAGDEVTGAEAPKLEGRGLFIDASFDYRPEVDSDSTLVCQGGQDLGWALHMVGGIPTLTVFMDGVASSIGADTLKVGTNRIRASIDAGGLMSLAVPGESEILGPAPFPSGFPRQPNQGLSVGKSFGVLPVKEFPNSTPFDGVIHRLRVTISP
ncbi:MAG TPA: sulfatase, partial [Prosthecobacter sp.]|nr:sulfatase [Prosthecobacter sp.]